MHAGSCLCGAIAFSVDAPLPPVEACHCSLCRKWTGHFLASVEVPRSALTIIDSGKLSWFSSSHKARRGFCARCGSSLFFDPLDQQKYDWIGIAMGAFANPTGTNMAVHIFTAEKGDYYSISDGLPEHEH